MIEVQDIRDLHPEFGCFSDKVIQSIIDETECIVSCNFGEQRKAAIKCLVAHELQLKTYNTSGGLVTSQKVGDLSTSYFVDDSDGDGYYRQTQHGLKYLNLRGSIVTTPYLID